MNVKQLYKCSSQTTLPCLFYLQTNLTMQAMAIDSTIQTIQGLIQVAMTQLVCVSVLEVGQVFEYLVYLNVSQHSNTVWPKILAGRYFGRLLKICR